jgi:hypothetical protein
MTDDDGSEWDRLRGLHALRAPGTPAELAGLEDAVAAFRAGNERGGPRRLARRLGVGATSTLLLIGVSGGVAAAYTRALPSPVQQVAHGLLASVGVPAAPTRRASTTAHSRGPVHPGRGLAVVAASPASTNRARTVTPAPSPPAGRVRPTRDTPRVTAAPSSGATPAATGMPSPNETKSRPAAVGVVTISVSAARVAPGGRVTVTATLRDASGRATAHRQARLQTRPAGSATWTPGAVARSGGSGSLRLTSVAITRTTRVRVQAASGAHSKPVTVVVVPTLTVTQQRAKRQDHLVVTTTGTEAGDALVVQRRAGASWTTVCTLHVDADGRASRSVPVTDQRQVLRLVLPHTSAHAASSKHVVIARRTPAGGS